MRVVAIIQARMGSSRLPGKVLLPLPTGRTVLEEVIGRVRQVRGLDHIVVAVPDTDIDRVLIEHVRRAGADVCAGPHLDVLHRYHLAAKRTGADVIMRITADCPLLSPSVCSDMLSHFIESGCDYYCNVMPRTFPRGYDCEVFTRRLLDFTHAKATRPDDREHVTLFMNSSWNVPNIKMGNLIDDRRDRSQLNYCVDTLEDYARICTMMEVNIARLKVSQNDKIA